MCFTFAEQFTIAMKKLFYLFLVFLLLLSCEKQENPFLGNWAVTEVNGQTQDSLWTISFDRSTYHYVYLADFWGPRLYNWDADYIYFEKFPYKNQNAIFRYSIRNNEMILSGNNLVRFKLVR